MTKVRVSDRARGIGVFVGTNALRSRFGENLGDTRREAQGVGGGGAVALPLRAPYDGGRTSDCLVAATQL